MRVLMVLTQAKLLQLASMMGEFSMMVLLFKNKGEAFA